MYWTVPATTSLVRHPFSYRGITQNSYKLLPAFWLKGAENMFSIMEISACQVKMSLYTTGYVFFHQHPLTQTFKLPITCKTRKKASPPTMKATILTVTTTTIIISTIAKNHNFFFFSFCFTFFSTVKLLFAYSF